MKNLSLVAALLLTASTSQAQQLRLGLKVGGNVSNAVGPDARESSWLVGLHGGITAQLRPAGLPNWGLQTEALYTMKGDNALLYGPNLMARLTYADIPLLLQYHWDDVFFEAGPQASYLISATANVPETVLPDFKAFVYGFAVGFGYQNDAGVRIGWRYNADLTNVTNPVEVNGEPTQLRMRNSVMELHLGYNAGVGQLGKAVGDAGRGIGRGVKFVVTAPFRIFRKKRPAPQQAAPSATPASTPKP
ncbi:porin family protein [Hymenobacter metallicola]|uniref:PorT family protein n=1 Tax=Hymenobacter metallicola TaxID=2563114 RepID=A0A4Z0Q7Z2_9BACT|nr:porin family protein [Hymenobacter metallicola]TGE26207.1 PorT family protein [Hymenobacter metallicola]